MVKTPKTGVASEVARGGSSFKSNFWRWLGGFGVRNLDRIALSPGRNGAYAYSILSSYLWDKGGGGGG